MQAFTQFMNSPTGRIARVLLGVVLIVVGVTSVGRTTGYIVDAVGLLLIGLGLSGRCLTELLPGS